MYKEHDVVWDDTKVSRFWDVVSRNKMLMETYFTRMVGKQLIEDIQKEVGIIGKEVLDYGSGPGYLFESILDLKLILKYYALEFSKDSIDELKARFESNDAFNEAYYVKSFPTTIDKRFDIIICCEVVEHLNEDMLRSFVCEAKKLLKKGGFIYITTPNDEILDLSRVNCPDCGCNFHRWQHVRSWDSNSLTSLMEANGFKTHVVKTLNYYERKNLVLKIKRFIRDNIFKKKTKHANLCYIGTI